VSTDSSGFRRVQEAASPFRAVPFLQAENQRQHFRVGSRDAVEQLPRPVRLSEAYPETASRTSIYFQS
jgi:hypothetical protein